MALNQVTVLNPSNISSPDGATVTALAGKSGESVVAELHGQWYTETYRGNMFMASVSGVTVPVNAATLVSTFSLYNPAGSGKNLELVSFDYGTVLATTVVDTLGLYFSTVALTAKGTFTTTASSVNCLLGGSGSAGVAIPYSAYTHSGTPVRFAIVGTWGAVTSTNEGPCHVDFYGKYIVPPGVVISAAMSTAASTGSGVDMALTWVEVPV